MSIGKVPHGDRVFVLTGAGVSAESGLPTFRGMNGLWRGYRVEDVATPEAFAADPALVWQFYSERRRRHQTVEPNPAHFALAELERVVGARFAVEPNPEKAATLILRHIESKRRALGLPHKDPASTPTPS